MTQPRDIRLDLFAELTKYVHPDWKLMEARIFYPDRAYLVVQDREDESKRLKDHYYWDGHAWILGASHTS